MPLAAIGYEMGKHVYVQKPLTHDYLWEARMLTRPAKKIQGSYSPNEVIKVFLADA